MTCYLIAQINIATLTVDWVGLYSDPNPTFDNSHRGAVLASCTADDFQTARDDMRKMLAHPYYAWVRPVLKDAR